MRSFRACLVLLMSCLFAIGADPITSDYLVYGGLWQPVTGVEGGIPDRTTVFTTVSAYTGSPAAITTALGNTPSNQVTALGSGTFSINSTLNHQITGVTLRGTTNANGVPTTKLSFTGASEAAFFIRAGTGWDFSNTNSFTNRKVTSPATNLLRGVTTVTLNSAPTGLDVGQTAFFTAPGPGNDFYGYGSSGAGRTWTHWVKVSAVSGSDVTFSPAISADFLAGDVWLSYKAGGSMVKLAGLEDVELELNGADAAIFKFYGATECWLKNVKITTTPGTANRHHIDNYGTFRCEVRHGHIGGQTAYGNSSYAINNYFSGGLLVIDNYFHDLANVMPMFNAHGGAFVYNYINGLSYDSPNGWLSQIVFFHRGHCDYNLFEGNWCATSFNDGGGASINNVWLANRMRGYDNDGATGTTTGNTECMTAASTHKRLVMLGNVLGETAVHSTVFHDFAVDEDTPGSTIFNVSRSSTNTFVRKGNYNTVDSAIPTFEQLAGGESMPDSYFVSSKPSPFGFLRWPPFTASDFNLSNAETNLPAMYRLANAGADPSASGGPSAPSGLSASAVSTSQINLTWTDNASDESGFEVQRALDSGFSSGLTTTGGIAANAAGYNSTGLSSATLYYYRVRATNAIGASSYTSTASATTQSGAVSTLPSRPPRGINLRPPRK